MELKNEPYYEITVDELKEKLGIKQDIITISCSMVNNSVKIWIEPKKPTYI